jgi:hypothetical protein
VGGEPADTVNHFTELSDTPSERIAYFSEDEIWDSDKSSEKFCYMAKGDDRDADDEVEEANAADDGMKVI